MARFRSRPLGGAPTPHIGIGTPAELQFADVELNLARHEVVRAGRFLSLTALEYELLVVFLRNPYLVLSRQQLAESVWQAGDVEGRSNFVDAAVMSLRRQLESAGQARLIHTVRGYGYALRSQSGTPDGARGGEGQSVG